MAAAQREEPADSGMPAAEPEIVIQGAGMSGIAMAIALKRAGRHGFIVLEQSAGVGGTWWDNQYPGAQCDVPSHLYSFSFELKRDWSRVFAPAAEIQRYVEHCVERYSLAAHLHFGREVNAAEYDANDGRWTVRTRNGEVYRPRYFIVSLGPLNHARLPAGIEAFRGKVMHTARWDHGYAFAGRRVAVVGSAASAVQVVPALAAAAARLTIFQRTPSWILDRPDRAYGRLARTLFSLPGAARAYRGWLYWRFEANAFAFKGHGFFYRLLARMARRHLENQVADPALRARLTPGYPLGCKRVLITRDYYPALQRPNVELVPLAAAGFTATGVVAADGSHREVDAIVCATGFETLDPLAAIEIRGRGGQPLSAAWADGPQAYRGVSVAGFPNLFLLLGPNTGTGHTSVLIPIEAQVRHVLACLDEARRRGARALEVCESAMRDNNADLQRRMSGVVWSSPACTSWYKTASGRVLATYPGFITRYVLETRRPRFGDYRFESHADPA
ncbi:MAG: NAD(P)/FAD-dependent oxidoreductase [Proteobacteria bacterium]|nr:NAD(P)/FAD-dependent oxidoreductase [Pseudomonadota bacterium]